MSILKKFFKDSIIYGLATVLPRLINFLLVRVQTDALHAENYAINTDFYIYAALFSIILSLGFETTFFRYFKDEQHKEQIGSTAFISIGVWTGIFILVFSLFFTDIQQLFHFENNPQRLKMFIIIMTLDTLAIIPFVYLRATNRSLRYMSIKLINVGIIVFVQLLTLRWIPNWEKNEVLTNISFLKWYHQIDIVDYIFLSNLFGSLVSLILVIPYLFRFKWVFDTALFKKMLLYSYPIIIAGLAYAINENMDKWIIGAMLDKKTEGLYAAAYKLAIFMNLYIMAFRLGAEPLFFGISKNEKSAEVYAKIMKYFVIIGSLVLVGIVLFIDIFKHLINSNYWVALDIVPVVLLANLFLGIYHNLSIWYKLIDKTLYGMWFSIVGAVLTIGINVFFIKEFGYMVAAWATLIAYGVMMLLSFFFGRKKYPIPYPIKSILIYLILATIISFTFFYKINLNLIFSTILMLTLFAIVWFVERKELKLS